MASYQRRSETEWQALVQEQEDSGLSTKAFCSERRIGTASFYKWRQRLSTGQRQVTNSAQPFVDVSALAMPTHSETVASWLVELELGDGLILRLNRG